MRVTGNTGYFVYFFIYIKLTLLVGLCLYCNTESIGTMGRHHAVGMLRAKRKTSNFFRRITWELE